MYILKKTAPYFKKHYIKIGDYIMKTKKILTIIAISIICILFWNKYNSKAVSVAAIQQGLADSIVRFHVVSAGDTDYEQSIKLLVKNKVLDLMSDKLSDINSKEETIAIIKESIPQIIKCANSVLLENNCNINVTADIEESFFPIKSYGDLTLPAGNYTALKIVLGNGEGTNWWCVLYPPLCFVDATYGIVPDESKATFKTILDEDEYNLIFGETVVFRFKILKFLNKFF